MSELSHRGGADPPLSVQISWYDVLVSVVGLAAGLFAAFLSALVETRSGAEKRAKVDSIDQRATRLSKSLTESIELIDEISKEIKTRQDLATKLQSDIKNFNEIAAMKKSEVEAVAQVFRGELRKDRSRSFRQTFFLNLVFFVLGVVVTLFVARII